VAARIRQLKATEPNEFIKKISDICAKLPPDLPKGMIILLGLDEKPGNPAGGNHRFMAALLAGGPEYLGTARMVAVSLPRCFSSRPSKMIIPFGRSGAVWRRYLRSF